MEDHVENIYFPIVFGNIYDTIDKETTISNSLSSYCFRFKHLVYWPPEKGCNSKTVCL